MKEQLVSLEVAKLLRENGFNIYCEWGYAGKKLVDLDISGLHLNSNNPSIYTAPTQSLAQKWLREFFFIDICILPNGNGYIHNLCKRTELDQFCNTILNTYEEALELALKEALKYI